MLYNWFLVEKDFWLGQHKELLSGAEQVRLARLAGSGRRNLFYAKALSTLGYQLVSAGTWLQHRFGGMLDFTAYEAKNQAWKS